MATTLPPPLADLTGYLLRRAYIRALEVAGSELGPGRHPRQLAVLMALDAAAAPCTQSWLAESLGMNRTVLGKLAEELEAEGLVARERSAEDRRSYALVPTAAGLEEIARSMPEIDRSDARLTAHLTPAERTRLNELLRKLLAGVPDRHLPEGLADRTGFLVTQVHLLLRSLADAGLRPLDVEVRHFGTMAIVAAYGPCSQQEVARALGVTPPVVVPIVDDLEARGLVARERNAHDRRSYALLLTPDGERTLAAAHAVLEELTVGPGASLREAGGRELRALLRKLLGA